MDALEDWRAFLLPLLLIERKGSRLVDRSPGAPSPAKKAAWALSGYRSQGVVLQ